MRKQLLYPLFLLGIISFIGCKKDTPVSDSLTGAWELWTDINGMTGKPTYHKPGNDTLVTFTETKYQFSAQGKIVRSGSYKVKQDTFSLDHTVKNTIVYDNQTNDIKIFFAIKDNQLSFFIDAYDASSTIYRRLK